MKHLIRLLDAVWSLTLGLYLGLSGGVVLAIIIAFQTTRSDQVLARPRAMPYADPRFEADWPGFVAGAIGNKLFTIAGIAVLGLAAIAIVAMLGRLALAGHTGANKPAWAARVAGMTVLAGAMALATRNVQDMNATWPKLYDPSATDTQLAQAREHFETLHQKSEQYVGAAWLAGAAALLITPWCTPFAAPAKPSS